MLGYEPILNSPMQFQLDEVNGAGRMNRTRGEIRSAKKAKLHRLLPYSGGLGMLLLALAPGLRAQCDVPTKSELHARGGVALITACEQEKHGDIYTARGNVEINYQNERLRAKQIDYNSTTGDATLTGDVKFDYGNQHISAQNRPLQREYEARRVLSRAWGSGTRKKTKSDDTDFSQSAFV